MPRPGYHLGMPRMPLKTAPAAPAPDSCVPRSNDREPARTEIMLHPTARPSPCYSRCYCTQPGDRKGRHYIAQATSVVQFAGCHVLALTAPTRRFVVDPPVLARPLLPAPGSRQHEHDE